MNNRKAVVNAIWQGADPFANFPVGEHAPDHQGWNSDHHYLSKAVEERRPNIIIEIGVWKGGSAKTMAAKAKSLNLDCVIIAIDTWLGSAEHWTDEKWFPDLRLENGYPKLYYTFAANVFDVGLEDYVVPFPLDSHGALHVISAKRIKPDVLHIDAGHDYHSALSDLESWWPLLNDGGILVGDDYYTDGVTWVEVKQAFDTFFGRTPHVSFESGDGKCYVKKP